MTRFGEYSDLLNFRSIDCGPAYPVQQLLPPKPAKESSKSEPSIYYRFLVTNITIEY